jgi:hypothetical protein
MTRLKIWSGACLLLIVLLVVILAITHMASAAPTSTPPPPPTLGPFQISRTYGPGTPAIVPHIAAGFSPHSSVAAFTKSDVMAYFNKYGFYAGPVVRGAKLQFLSIQFVTASQAFVLMRGESIGLPGNSLVCYVKVQGPFALKPISVPYGAKLVTTAKTGAAVFDAHTGNMLLWSFYP